MRKFVAGWMSRFGGCWVAQADRVYGPPELNSAERVRREAAKFREILLTNRDGTCRSVELHGADGSVWNLIGGGSDLLPPERRESRGWN
jgi:hypothetical protein